MGLLDRIHNRIFGKQIKQQTIRPPKESDFKDYTMIINRYKEVFELFCNRVFTVSQDLVPIDTGNLADSGGIEFIQGHGVNTLTCVIEYNAPYATYVHEILFTPHDSPRSAKYLETAYDIVMAEGLETPNYKEFELYNGVISYGNNGEILLTISFNYGRLIL